MWHEIILLEYNDVRNIFAFSTPHAKWIWSCIFRFWIFQSCVFLVPHFPVPHFLPSNFDRSFCSSVGTSLITFGLPVLHFQSIQCHIVGSREMRLMLWTWFLYITLGLRTAHQNEIPSKRKQISFYWEKDFVLRGNRSDRNSLWRNFLELNLLAGPTV